VSDPRIIVDTGPLLAFLFKTDQHYQWADEQFSSLPPPFLTCEPVLSELFYLVWKRPNGPSQFLELLDTGLLMVDFQLMAERDAISRMVRKYEDLPISLADACLVRMSEMNEDAIVFTTDSHFRVYRKNGRQQIPLLMPA
jgi:predicted nucleic acid-binding protein